MYSQMYSLHIPADDRSVEVLMLRVLEFAGRDILEEPESSP